MVVQPSQQLQSQTLCLLYRKRYSIPILSEKYLYFHFMLTFCCNIFSKMCFFSVFDQLYIHCDVAICQPTLGNNCEPRCFRKSKLYTDTISTVFPGVWSPFFWVRWLTKLNSGHTIKGLRWKGSSEKEIVHFPSFYDLLSASLIETDTCHVLSTGREIAGSVKKVTREETTVVSSPELIFVQRSTESQYPNRS